MCWCDRVGVGATAVDAIRMVMHAPAVRDPIVRGALNYSDNGVTCTVDATATVV